MNINKVLKLDGTLLDKNQLRKHLEKMASNHDIISKSSKETYPIPNMRENFEFIKETYILLNEHVKLGINIHPAGEWILDNFYIIEETVKQIEKQLPLKKYKKFLGISNGNYQGFARIYVLASEIVAYTEGKIEKEDLEEYIASYQTKRTLNMDEIWNIGLFLQLAIINNIKNVCEKIYNAQLQKYKVEEISERLIENTKGEKQKFKKIKTTAKKSFEDIKYPFVEYMAYILKRHGKKGYSYLKALDEIVEMAGTSTADVIKKEHFDIALKKVLMANYISSIKKIQRMNFLEIFENLNGVEDILKKDPANVYLKMDHSTKSYYRNRIKEISHKTKISEIYIAKKVLELANKYNEESNEKNNNFKKSHIGYYLIDKGINELYQVLNYKKSRIMSNRNKSKVYILSIIFFTIFLDLLFVSIIDFKNILLNMLSFILLLIPSSEVIIQITQYILGKIVKPKLIPKLDFSSGIDEENTTFVVIPTIIKNRKKVKELMHKLEVFYIANKSNNLYFVLLGDCSESDKKEEKFDNEVIEEGLKQVELLNEKYRDENNNREIFHFIYRNRSWNEKEEKYLGWERKRGLLNQFNEYILGHEKDSFRVNTFENIKREYIRPKYIITLDADTDLVLSSAFELVGAMAHILNIPVIDENKNIVIDGYGIMQPRVGINLDISYKNLFTKIFAGDGGTDSYTNAISDLYQDNFGEGIFTGKGIYDVNVFSKIMQSTIPENTVLSHDLLEGNYLRCGLVSDIMLMDGYPTKYISFITRLARWIRGDWQLTMWLKKKVRTKCYNTKNPLNLISKYKILDNLRRSLLEISIFVGILYLEIIKATNNYVISNPSLRSQIGGAEIILLLISIIPFVLEFFDLVISKKEGEKKQRDFEPRISGLKGIFLRFILTFGCLPYKAYVSAKSIIKTIYRTTISKKHLLEWTTSEEAEIKAKVDIFSYYKHMIINVILGIILFLICKKTAIISVLWLVIPYIMYRLSKEECNKSSIEVLNKEQKDYIVDLAKKTWSFFEDYLTEENNYLITDNYQEDRKNKIVLRTSSTNIGLSILAVISAYDMDFIDIEKCIFILNNIMKTVNDLEKWNGHLYNWYSITDKKPLMPKYVSTVDSGNFVGYLYVLKVFLENLIGKKDIGEQKNIIDNMILVTDKLINDTDFSKLYDYEHQIFSIGFNVEENKLTDSYYDLLASESRQASLIAIAKKDIPTKHWKYLSRTLTTLNGYSGLVSWSGTAFEYLMPNINIPKYEGSLLDESCKFMIMSQIDYAKKLNIPWGISEAAFNLKDLQSNYQYKAFGIPWLGLKRGLADEFVISSYGSILAINDMPLEVVKNMQLLEQYGMKEKYGFYESIDFTPGRVEKNKKASVVKTYMAHHQGLILASLNNFINNNIIQKRFMKNPEIEAISILLQERKPDKYIVTKEDKEKIEKLKYKDYESYITTAYPKVDEKLIYGNVISNENYTVAFSQKGHGFSKYKDVFVNRFKETSDYLQGIYFYIKNIKTKDIMTTNYSQNDLKKVSYETSFSPDKNEIKITSGNINAKVINTLDINNPVEIRRLVLENNGNAEETLEVSSCFEPVLSTREQDYAHPAFNNLFLIYEYDKENETLIVKRKTRDDKESKCYLITSLVSSEKLSELEYEIDKEKLKGRGNLDVPNMIKNSIPFSNRIGLVTNPVVSFKRVVKIKPGEKIILDLLLSVEESKENAIKNFEIYKNSENVERTLELEKAKVDTESRYLGIKGRDILNFQKILSYIIFNNPARVINIDKCEKKKYKKSELWKYGISGDLPIILVKIEEESEIYLVREILKAYEFFMNKNIQTELIILDKEKYSYENYVREEIENCILNNHMGYLKNIRGGIYTISQNEINKEDLELLDFTASIVINSKIGGIENNLKEIEEEFIENYREIANEEQIKNLDYDNSEEFNILEDKQDLKYYNEYGAFSSDGREYLISVNKNKRLPTVWSNILANEKFGTVITESLGGYTWYKNSRLNRLTAWENDTINDTPSECIYIKNLDNQESWSLGLNPMPDDKNYNVIFGFGYCKYIHKSQGIEQEMEVFVPREDSIKVGILKLRNTTSRKKRLKIIYYAKPVLGEDEIKSNRFMDLTFDINNNVLYASNLYNNEFEKDIMYVSCSEKIKSYTGDKSFFFGQGGIQKPDGLRKITLNNENSLGKNSCMAYEIEVELKSFSEKSISILLGAEESILDVKNMSYKYSKVENCIEELNNVKKYWEEITTKCRVETPLESLNILLNGWLAYQIISSRLYAKSGFYQSGGATGYRDQLQDTIGLKILDREILKNQIIKHSKHQFLEGDVEHWWHDETKRGIRTRFSDDLLWLVFAVIEYINFTGDKQILDIETYYLKGNELKDDEDEKYDIYEEGNIKESIYMHCIRAIEKSLYFGTNGLPKIGSGDWNDGFNKVGNKGIGESVWLGFFIYYILDKFILICEEKNDLKRVEKYKEVKEKLKIILNSKAWDGRWYKRAFMDDGNALGSMENDECKIDSISQSWSIISNAGDNDKKYIAMESLENHLVNKEEGIIKLLDPPFENGKLNPGYIKSYLPGVRENGGQYTHASCWVIIAEAILGFGDKALEYFRMINPIEHSKTMESANKYKVEPYVISADIYGADNLIGRGGWTWYTGSASWYYKAGIEYILGLRIENGKLRFEPCIPSNWKEYSIKYKWESSIYNVKVKNPNGKNKGVTKVIMDGNVVDNSIKLDGTGNIYNIEVII